MAPGVAEIIVVSILLVVFFGAKKVPELFKGAAKGINEFKKASKDDSDSSSN